MDSPQKALELDEIGELIEFVRSELADRELSNLDDYVGAARRAVEIAERLPALLERETIKAPVPRSDQMEEAAQLIYKTWAAAPGYVPWVARGNSWRQDDARRIADKIVAPLLAERDRLAGEVAAKDAEIARLTKERDESAKTLKLTFDAAYHYQNESEAADLALQSISHALGGPVEWTDQTTMIADVEQRVATARQTIANLREALEFYTNPQVYEPDSVGRVGDLTFSARAALARHDAPKPKTPPIGAKRPFVVGDKVVRVSGGEWFGMREGDFAVITRIEPTKNKWSQLWLTEFGGIYSDVNFRAAPAEKSPDDMTDEEIVAELKFLPCPICNGVEGCDHTVPERERAALEEITPAPTASYIQLADMLTPEQIDEALATNPLPEELARPSDTSGPELLAYCRDDASKWAHEFHETAIRLGYSDMDEGWLIGWFANAIEHSSVVRRQRSERLRAEPAETDEAIDSRVRVVVSGLTSSGKSAIAGEIEIALRAIGVPVEWPDGAAEKNMTHADWQTALDLYKPRVVIVERNIPREAK